MAIERWTDERLDELADQVQQTSYNVELLVGAINGLVTRMDADREIARTVQSDIRTMQTDIRGLQTENRRILERLEQHFNEEHSDNDEQGN
ncbi:MAG TPA: hypothetical protein V6D18_10810 [Thermosynechococcaceae cyanobacterium]